MRHDGSKCLSAVLLSLLFATTACTVMESRVPCPCWATVNLEHFRDLKDFEHVMTGILTSSRLIERETVALTDYDAQPYEKKLENRIPTTISSVCGFDAMTIRSDSLVCERGMEVSRIWTSSLTQDCNDDLVYYDLQPHKDYTNITFIVLGIASSDEFQYDMRVRANYNGIRLRDRKPVEGSYLAYVRPLEAGVMFEVRVPRQADYEMVLDILSPRSDRMYTVDDRFDIIDLGRLLMNQGFSWDKEDLDDVIVTIDFARLSTSIAVDEWDDETIKETI